MPATWRQRRGNPLEPRNVVRDAVGRGIPNARFPAEQIPNYCTGCISWLQLVLN